MTAYDDWKHWLAREIEAAAVAKERELAVRVLADVLERSGAAKLDATREDDARLLLKLARERA